MTISTIRETAEYELVHDRLQGVSSFVHKDTQEQSYWDTGHSCFDTINLAKATTLTDSEFDAMALDAIASSREA